MLVSEGNKNEFRSSREKGIGVKLAESLVLNFKTFCGIKNFSEENFRGSLKFFLLEYDFKIL